ncbi:MAG: hypothetical protein JWM96_273, partial [Alphaproteobacteria bacterium]|nr:hypothetical protein [Alphaproteobacteria bacterium]
ITYLVGCACPENEKDRRISQKEMLPLLADPVSGTPSADIGVALQYLLQQNYEGTSTRLADVQKGGLLKSFVDNVALTAVAAHIAENGVMISAREQNKFDDNKPALFKYFMRGDNYRKRLAVTVATCNRSRRNIKS